MNEMNKSLLVGLLGIALVLGGYATFFKESKVVVQTVQTKDGEVQVGAVFPFTPTPELNIGGFRLSSKDIPLQTGSSTVCAIQSPSATSTLLSGGIRFTLASSTAQRVEIARNTTQYSTTTRIGSLYDIAASAQATIIASSTGSVAGDATIFPPSTWFVIRMAGGPGTAEAVGNAPTGSCYALWGLP